MELVKAVLFIIIGFGLLVGGANVFVDRASGIAHKLNVAPLIIGLTVVAFGTSMPELAVSVTAALEGSNEIAVGNVVGSNMFNLLVVAGLSACIMPLAVTRDIIKRDWPVSIAAAVLLTVFLLGDLTISRIEALVLCVCFVAVLLWQIKTSEPPKEKPKEETRSMLVLIVGVVIGIACIAIGGELAVQGAKSVAAAFGLSETLIGLTIVAVGTSLPELVTSLVAAAKHENDLAMGNVIGSNVFNLLCILGISGVLRPICVPSTALIDAAILTVISIVGWLLCRKGSLSRVAGGGMVLTYVIYMIYIIQRV